MDTELEIKKLQKSIDLLEKSIKWLEALKDKKDYEDTIEDIEKLIKVFKNKLKKLRRLLGRKVDELVDAAEIIAQAEGLI